MSKTSSMEMLPPLRRQRASSVSPSSGSSNRSGAPSSVTSSSSARKTPLAIHEPRQLCLLGETLLDALVLGEVSVHDFLSETGLPVRAVAT